MNTDSERLPDGVDPCVVEYTNWRGIHGRRSILPLTVDFRSTKWHPVAQWLMKAFDLQVGAERDFAIVDFGPRVTLAGKETMPSGWIVGEGPNEVVVRDAAEASDRAARGAVVRPFYDDATVAELERIRRQLLVLAEGGGDHAAFAKSVLNAQELPS